MPCGAIQETGTGRLLTVAHQRRPPGLRMPDNRPPGWFLTRRLTNEPNLDDFHAGTLSRAVSGRRGLSPATIEQHLLTRRSTE